MFKLQAIMPKHAHAYKKAGQQGEVIAAFTSDGLIIEPDPNTPHYIAGDYTSPKYGQVQVKTPRATVCEGSYNIEEYIAVDKADMFAYVVKSQEWVVFFTRSEWVEFVKLFSVKCLASDGITPKLRLDHETAMMLMWLDNKINGISTGRPYYYYTRG